MIASSSRVTSASPIEKVRVSTPEKLRSIALYNKQALAKQPFRIILSNEKLLADMRQNLLLYLPSIVKPYLQYKVPRLCQEQLDRICPLQEKLNTKLQALQSAIAFASKANR